MQGNIQLSLPTNYQFIMADQIITACAYFLVGEKESELEGKDDDGMQERCNLQNFSLQRISVLVIIKMFIRFLKILMLYIVAKLIIIH